MQPTALAWRGMFMLPQCLNCDVIVNSLGEACSHIAVITSCMINATEVCKQTGADSCTSNLCGWNQSAREVSISNACIMIM